MHYILFTLSLFIAFNPLCYGKQRVTNLARQDGFGAQYQTLIYSAIYADLHDMEFVYTPFAKMEHNYDNDPDFLAKKEWLINFKSNFKTDYQDLPTLNWGEMIQFFESNLQRCRTSNALKKLKQMFRANKETNHYRTQNHLNIVIHLRRPNPHDNRIYGADISDEVYLSIVNRLRKLYKDQNPIFHIHSQGKPENFVKFHMADVILHLNDSVEDSFTQMVLADILVTTRSSLSYAAGILCEGTVYYISFWHPPLPGWTPVEELLSPQA